MYQAKKRVRYSVYYEMCIIYYYDAYRYDALYLDEWRARVFAKMKRLKRTRAYVDYIVIIIYCGYTNDHHYQKRI